MIEKRNPATVGAPLGRYSHAVRVTGLGELVFVAGQVGLDKQGKLAPTIEGQFENVFRAIKAILADCGLGLSHIVKITTFLTDPAHVGTYRTVRDREWPKEQMGGGDPAATLVYVKQLADPAWVVEIEVVAAKA